MAEAGEDFGTAHELLVYEFRIVIVFEHHVSLADINLVAYCFVVVGDNV
jgi:hypothetical protein